MIFCTSDNVFSSPFSEALAAIDERLDSILLPFPAFNLEAIPSILEARDLITFVEDIKEGESAIGFKTLATIADPAKMQVVYQGNEQEINKLKLGMPVEISYSNKSYTGKVAMTKENSPKEDADKFKQNVVISFDKMPESVKIGATASVSIVLAKKDNTLIVPKTAVKEYSGSCSVSVLDNGRKRDVPVQIGIKGDTIYEVVSGLTEGQEVIIG